MWENQINQLLGIIRKTELQESVKWGKPCFTYNGKNVVSVVGFKHHYALWFHKGAQLKDANNLLVNAQEGVTKSLRQMRFDTSTEIDESIVLLYVLEAIKIEKMS